MKKKIIIVLISIITIIGLTTFIVKNIKYNTKEETKTKLTEEEQLWKDAEDSRIYNLKLFLRDSMSSFIDGNIMFDSKIEKLESISNNNIFAKKILTLYKDSNISNILNNGTDLEKTLLYTYLGIRTNHYEGMGVYQSNIIDDYIDVTKYEINNIYYKGSDENGKFTNTSRGYGIDYLFVFKKIDETDTQLPSFVYVFSNGYFDSDYYTNEKASSQLMLKFHKNDNNFANYLLKEYDGKPSNFGPELSKEIINKVLNENKDFLDFYIKYKNDIYYPRWDKEHE